LLGFEVLEGENAVLRADNARLRAENAAMNRFLPCGLSGGHGLPLIHGRSPRHA
jgi:hypothetical protein